MSEQFKYEVFTCLITDMKSVEALRLEVENRFNSGWKPTTNGPCMAMPVEKVTHLDRGVNAMPLRPEESSPVEITSYLVMYVFAKEVSHDN
jgi:hypothetical protein